LRRLFLTSAVLILFAAVSSLTPVPAQQTVPPDKTLAKPIDKNQKTFTAEQVAESAIFLYGSREQLAKIRRVITSKIPLAPHEVLLVLDATAGQNAISQAQGFSEAAGCTGIVLAKLDGTAKGGVVIPIRRQFNLPVKYIGVGEKAEDLALFNVDQFVEALFDDVG